MPLWLLRVIEVADAVILVVFLLPALIYAAFYSVKSGGKS